MEAFNEEEIVTLQRNPLLINTVIKRVFDHLTLEDVKRCRTVCKEWKSVSTPILKKLTNVKIDSNERITNFMEFFSDYGPQELPFTSFHLDFFNNHWNSEKLTDFFNTWGESIIALTFKDRINEEHDLTPWIDLATNLIELNICSFQSIDLDKLAKVKFLSLGRCHLIVNSFENRIAPLSIILICVTFKQNGNKLPEIVINDYVDFSNCSKIMISNLPDFFSNMTIDMSRDIVSARKIHFRDIRVLKWKETQSKVGFLTLEKCPFEEKTKMEIKQLYFSSSNMNVSSLPKSLEKLSLTSNTYGTIHCVPFDFPNLTYFSFNPDDDDTRIPQTANEMSFMMSMLGLCPKLVDMELTGLWYDNWHCNINVDLLPASLKRIKLYASKNINFVGGTEIDVDSLIVDETTFEDTLRVMNKIKPKIVVVGLSRDKLKHPADKIIRFVEENQHLQLIVVAIPEGYKEFRFYRSGFDRYVDKESNYYEFTNQVGKALTKQEFKVYFKIK